ncbi:MAG: A/G-specific adenine glycosylase [Pseudomonadota bacterium]
MEWYDRHARRLPWRVPPEASKEGVRADPYRVWLSEVMLQQTTVAAATGYYLAFTERWPDVDALAAAEDAEVMAAWAGLGYYARARNLLKCARAVSAAGGRFPTTEDALQALPGIGPYTGAAIAAIAFGRRATVLDGNVERVMARLFAVEAPLPGAKETLRAHAARLTPEARPGDHAQAVMDLGATICTPRSPACGICPWRPACAGQRLGLAETLPRKAPKKAKPTRRGIAYFARRPDGSVLLEDRPPKGLLGGMRGLPTTEWVEATPRPAPPCEATWTSVPGAVRHTFTHFHLVLDLAHADVPAATVPARGRFLSAKAAPAASLPTVMRKAYSLGVRCRNDAG